MRSLLLLIFVMATCAASAQAASAPDLGDPFEPHPQSRPLYGTKAPTVDAARQRKVLEAVDGVDLFVETWLPEAKDGNTPPARVPTVLIMTPYVQEGEERYPARNQHPVIAWFTARGYAVAQHHVRGTGSSGGCLEQTASRQIDDAARVIEYLGRDAPWADGNVGMYGISYDGETQISVAGRGDQAKTKYLKAITPAETVGGQYEYSFLDGVPYTGQALLSNASYLALTSLDPGRAPVGAHTFERFGCQGDIALASVDSSGDFTPYWQVREYRPDAPNIRAATLWIHGLADWNVNPIALAGYFDRLPASTPHKGVFGVWEHNYPDKHAGVSPDWEREDFLAMVTAWFDRWLKGLDTGVEDWPPVQVQGSDGQWRVEAGFPQTGGPVGHLALGAGGVLGSPAPSASTSFNEGLDDSETVPGTRAVFETPALAAPLHLTGQPVLDLWLETSMPDAHVTAKLQVLAPSGSFLAYEGSVEQEVGTFGARSLRHLDPMPENWFRQTQGQPAPTGTPLRVALRFHPTDIVVPRGGKIRLTVAGATDWTRSTQPSAAFSTIEVLHDCAHPSALRFLVARPDGLLLNVRERDERRRGALPSGQAPVRVTDGAGLASAPVCGRPPERLALFGPEIALPALARRVLRLTLERRRLRTALRSGLRVRTRCQAGCGLAVRAYTTRGRRRTLVARARDLAAGEGARTHRLRFTRAARKRLRRSRRVRLTIVATARDARGARKVATRRVTLR